MKRLVSLLVAAFFFAMPFLYVAKTFAITIANGKVVYIQNDQLWISNADGTVPQQLTNDQAVYSSPSLSPDKTNVAVERKAGNENVYIYIVPVSGGSSYRLSTQFTDYLGLGSPVNYYGSQYRPVWSPDSTRVAFYAEEFANPGSDPNFVYESTLGGVGRQFGNGYDPSYAPDGTALAWIVDEPIGITQYAHVKQATFLTNTITELYRTTQSISSFSWSPTSDAIALLVGDNSGWNTLLLIQASVNYSLQIPQDYSDNTYSWLTDVAWSPTGETVALIGEDEMSYSSVVIFNVNDHSFTSVLRGSENTQRYRYPIWDTTGNYLLVSYESDIEAPYDVVVLDILHEAVTALHDGNYLPGRGRDIKDWRANLSYQANPPTVPQVLGTNTEETKTSTNKANGAVLGATTLPSTGIGKQSFVCNSVLIAVLAIFGTSFIYAYATSTKKR